MPHSNETTAADGMPDTFYPGKAYEAAEKIDAILNEVMEQYPPGDMTSHEGGYLTLMRTLLTSIHALQIATGLNVRAPAKQYVAVDFSEVEVR